MLHRVLLTLSLIFAFGFAQIGAVSHQFSHDIAYVNALSAQVNTASEQLSSTAQYAPEQSLPDHTVCEQCIGFGGLTHTHQTAAYTLTLLQNGNARFTHTTHFTASLKSLSRSARAPPFSLV